jgi:Fe-S-cluster containining protein
MMVLRDSVMANLCEQITAPPHPRAIGYPCPMRLPAGDSELVQIMDAALEDAARRAGPLLACRIGCTQCCYGAFAIGPLDTLRLRVGMEELRASDPALASKLEHRARAWIAEHPSFPGDPATGLLGESDADRAAFESYADEAACPALDPVTGRCDVYAFRPMTCRVFGPPVEVDAGPHADGPAYAHCELCFIGATPVEVAACAMPVPHDLEASLIEEVERQGLHDETIVAFALLPS